jgi:hypothetical protein
MLTIKPEKIARLEKTYPGIARTLDYFETMTIPRCPKCRSVDTALVQVGIVGRSVNLACATTKFHLLANGGGEPMYFCNKCRKYFGPPRRPHSIGQKSAKPSRKKKP